MSTMALFIWAENGEEPKSSSTGEFINKMWHIHISEYYLARKMKSWHHVDELQNYISPSVRSWSQKHYMLYNSIYINVQKRQIHGDSLAVWGVGYKQGWLQKDKDLLGVMETWVLVMTTQLNFLKIIALYTQKPRNLWHANYTSIKLFFKSITKKI